MWPADKVERRPLSGLGKSPLFHELANLFPLMDGDAYLSFVEDIRQHGVREPIVMLDGQILDGRNRYLAAREAVVDCSFTQYEGDDPLAYVISLNLARRHLSESQRALVAAKLATMRQGERTDLSGHLAARPRKRPRKPQEARNALCATPPPGPIRRATGRPRPSFSRDQHQAEGPATRAGDGG